MDGSLSKFYPDKIKVKLWWNLDKRTWTGLLDVSDAVIQMISAKPHVQIQDIVIRHVQETSAIPEV